MDWWYSLSIVSQVFACVAIPSTVLLLAQTVIMLIGMGSDTAADDVDVDAEIDSELEADVPADSDGVFGSEELEVDSDVTGMDSLRVFTVRGIIAFLVVFGWVGVVMDSAGAALWISLAVATVSGVAVMFALAFMMRAVLKLRDNGNIDNRNAIGVAGKVYLTIPPKRSGEGKVNVMLQGVYVERDAVTDEAEPIPTGCEVVVVALSGQTTLVVKRK